MLRRAIIAVSVALGIATLYGCGDFGPSDTTATNADLSREHYGYVSEQELEQEEREMKEEEGVAAWEGNCVNTLPSELPSDFDAEVVSCDSPRAFGTVTEYPEEYCGPGYSGSAGEALGLISVEGETRCVEARKVSFDQIEEGLPGSPRYRCVQHVKSISDELKCFQLSPVP